MAVPLIVLAIGSVLAGYVGVPHALGGTNWIEGFLHPSFEVTAESHGVAAAPDGQPAAPEAAQADAHAADVGTERLLMAISSGLALAGIGLAVFFWLRRPDVPASMARSLSGVYRLLLNKYYVDEIYDAAVVQPMKRISTAGLWKGVDAGLIDGSVNGVGALVSGGSSVLRRLQTGSLRAYAAALLFGGVAILSWYLWTVR
jgi:NADH-quinone oxidoreductase subunit L